MDQQLLVFMLHSSIQSPMREMNKAILLEGNKCFKVAEYQEVKSIVKDILQNMKKISTL